MNKQDLERTLDQLPQSPGIYLMKGQNGHIVYVGKAKNLRFRVRQYFAPGTSDTRVFVKNLAQKLSSIETVLTSTEKEALLLEYNLIQRYLPRYNIRLTDDKRFLHLRLDPTAPWPRLELVRKPKKDGALYFGPYHSAGFARQTLKLCNRHFKLRSCREHFFKNRVRPCLQYQIKRCLAPCTMPVEPDRYQTQVRFVQMFLEGRKDDLINDLRQRMNQAAEQLAYEAAAELRDQIQAVESTLATQRVTQISDIDQDVLGIHRAGDQLCLVLLEVMEGRLQGQRRYFFKQQEFPTDEIVSSFLVQHYRTAHRIPDELIIPLSLSDEDALAEWLSELRGRRVKLWVPKRGKRLDQVRLANMNADQVFLELAQKANDTSARLEFIARKLHLTQPPHRIECVDIAHHGGQDTVAGISAVVNGQTLRRDGRTFLLPNIEDGDDFAAMEAVLKKRFTRAATGDPDWAAPDLLLIDGGKGQLAVAVKVLAELGLTEQQVAAIAKERTGKKSADADRVFLPGRINPVKLNADTSALFILAMARDEAHRLANGFLRKRRKKRTIRSALDKVPGVGPALKQRLLRKFGSARQVGLATEADLQTVRGVGPRLAHTIATSLQRQKR